MVLARQGGNTREAVQGGVSLDDSGKDYDTEKGDPALVTVRGPKSGASRKATPKRKGEQLETRRSEGELSKLPWISCTR